MTAFRNRLASSSASLSALPLSARLLPVRLLPVRPLARRLQPGLLPSTLS